MPDATAGGSTDQARWLQRIAAGDEGAFRSLYDVYAGKLAGLFGQLGVDGAHAEELVQDVFLAVWRRAGAYQPARGTVAAWLFAIARNRLSDHRRRRRRRPQEAAELDPSAWAAPDDAPDERLGLAGALSRLPAEQRRAVVLAYFGGYSYEETATRLALPLGTCKSRIRLALAKLRTTLEMR